LKSLAINPGSTSTKIAVFSGESEIWNRKISHNREEIDSFEELIDQLDWRRNLILAALKEGGFSPGEFDFIMARGGLLDPIPGGTYLIDEEMVQDLRQGKNGEHASNLAAIIARDLAEYAGVPAFTVDPVAVDEFKPEARLSGLPELPRKCQSHALNLKATARKTAERLEQDFREINLIGVHLGGGISIAALKSGRIVDVNNANQGGPYSPERTGTLPSLDLVEYIYQEKQGAGEMEEKIVGRGGLVAYLGTADGREVEERIAAGDSKAELVYRGMIYQIAKEVGAMAAVLSGKIAAIFITGGLANSDYLVGRLEKKINFLAPVHVFPGAAEMEHLAAGGLRVMRGEEEARSYAEARR